MQISNLSKITALTFLFLILTVLPVFADSTITFQKTLDVEKTNLQNALVDVKNYEKVFPDFVKSADVLEKSEDKILTEFSLGFGMIPLKVKAEHNILNENNHELSIVSGDLRGTKITTTLKETWGFDGAPEKGTIVKIDMSLSVSGFLAWLGIIDDNLIHHALDSSLFRLQEFSNGNSEEIEPQKSFQKKRR